MNVLIGCEFSQVLTRAFRERGHDAFSCDLIPTEGNLEWHIQDDVLNHLKDNIHLFVVHPDCTYLTVTGNKWMKPEYKTRFPNRIQQRQDAIHFFMKLVNAPIKHICVENPVGIMSTIYRKPDQIIQPYQFGHKEPKKTCLWLKNLPKLTPTNIVEPEYFTSKSGKRLASWYYKPSYTPERQKMRQRTFIGIANAMADQWSDL